MSNESDGVLFFVYFLRAFVTLCDYITVFIKGASSPSILFAISTSIKRPHVRETNATEQFFEYIQWVLHRTFHLFRLNYEALRHIALSGGQKPDYSV